MVSDVKPSAQLAFAQRLVRGLMQPRAYDHAAPDLRLIETHISWVVLTGPFAYKIKKPVDLGFVDFSTLERRQFCCHEELRLNRRLAPDLYLDVLAIRGTVDEPRLGGDGDVLEYAVKMKQFSQDDLLSHLLEQQALLPAHVDSLAAEVARFHATIDVAEAGSPFGGPEQVLSPVLQNFEHLAESATAPTSVAAIKRMRAWSEAEFTKHVAEFTARKAEGFVRECHGDMHLGNMVLHEGDVTVFDCIEFNESLRWIDVLSETAFVVMDLADRGRPDLAGRFLNGYLEITGDYCGLALMPFYLAYRALVRAKVAVIRMQQGVLGTGERDRLHEELESYLELAEGYTRQDSPMLIITHGFSGSGKTSGTGPLVEALWAVRIRSDVERRRLFGGNRREASVSRVGEGRYSAEATRETYARLAELAADVIRAGCSAIVDAAFLSRSLRDEFHQLAERLNVPFVLLDFRAPEALLKERLAFRAEEGRDASEANIEVLNRQLQSHEPLTPDELHSSITVDAGRPNRVGSLIDAVLRRSVT